MYHLWNIQTCVKEICVPRGVSCPGTDAMYMVKSLTAWSLALLEEEELGRDEPLIWVCSPLPFEELARSKPILKFKTISWITKKF